jgi:hypothetical protein
MKKLLRNSLFIGAALLGVSSLGAGITTKAATTATPLTSDASADITPGTITLDTVPGGGSSTTSGILFGTVAADAGDTTYKSTQISSDLHVTDSGNGSGWAVTVADSPFTDTAGDTLKGAVLSLDDSANPAIKADATDNVSALPTFTADTTLSASPSTVLSAAPKAGVGAYTTTYNGTDASLAVPAGNIGGSYSSTLTWTLSNAPS